jgi:fucose permease
MDSPFCVTILRISASKACCDFFSDLSKSNLAAFSLCSAFASLNLPTPSVVRLKRISTPVTMSQSLGICRRGRGGAVMSKAFSFSDMVVFLQITSI